MVRDMVVVTDLGRYFFEEVLGVDKVLEKHSQKTRRTVTKKGDFVLAVQITFGPKQRHPIKLKEALQEAI